eukprot:751829-Hanusia_phi.AAC.2
MHLKHVHGRLIDRIGTAYVQCLAHAVGTAAVGTARSVPLLQGAQGEPNGRSLIEGGGASNIWKIITGTEASYSQGSRLTDG